MSSKYPRAKFVKLHESRIERLREILEKKKLDAALFFAGESDSGLSSKNAYYLSGFFDPWPHAVLVAKKDEALFTADTERAENEAAIKAVISPEKGGIEKFLKSRGIKRIGIDSNFSFSRWSLLKKTCAGAAYADISQEMLELRAIKDRQEIEKIRRACEVTASALEIAQKNAQIGDEAAIAGKINSEFLKSGAEAAFRPIVAGDANSANVHYFGCGGIFSKILMADIGARLDFYNSDFTRTFVLGGDSGGKMMVRAHETLSQLVSELSEFIKPEVKCADAFDYAKKFLEKAGYKKESFANFHGLGHGVGLNVHEFPVISKNPLYEKMRFGENTVFTIEPALYFKGMFGIRIEDTVLLGKNGVKRMGHSPD